MNDHIEIRSFGIESQNMCDLVELDKKSDQYIKYYELYDFYLKDRSIFDESSELKKFFLQTTNQRIAFVDETNCGSHTEQRPIFKYTYRVIHEYEDFKDFEHIAHGCNDLFNVSLDYAFARILKRIIGPLDENHYCILSIIIHDPVRTGITCNRTQTSRFYENFFIDSIRKLLHKQDLIFNLLVTKKITFSLSFNSTDPGSLLADLDNLFISE